MWLTYECAITMPAFEETTQDLVNGLFSQEQSTRLAALRKIKNSIIGNKTKKSCFMVLGVIPRLVNLLSQVDCSSDMVREAIITLGSFAHGTHENVWAVLRSKALPLLIRGLTHADSAVVSSSIRTLRIVYESGLAPSDPIFQDPSIARLLVHMVSGSPLIAQCAITILTKACQLQDHQNQLCALGVMGPLAQCLQSHISKLLLASLHCLSAIAYDNTMCANIITTAYCGEESVVAVVIRILSGNHSNEVKLASALCISRLCQSHALSPESCAVTLKALPALVRLCKVQSNLPLNTQAANTLAFLTQDNVELQELAANSDRLISTLVSYLGNQPDDSDELVEEKQIVTFELLRESCLLALASLSSSREEIRMKVVSERNVMKYISEGLAGNNVEVRIAACKCLHSLSRSTKLLRTSIIDAEVWKPVLEMLSLRDEDCLVSVSGVAANLLLAFSPSREKLVEGGCLISLCHLSSHDNPKIQLNAVWALMSAAYDCSSEIRSQIKQHLGMERLFEFLSPSCSEKLLLKALGLTVNLLHVPEEVEWVLSEHGRVVMSSLISLLHHHPNDTITEQVMCVLINISSTSAKSRDDVINCDEIIQALASVLRNSEKLNILTAACTVVNHLVDTSFIDHVHRQNRLEEYGVKIAVQKLEKTEHTALKNVVKDVLDHFASITL